MSVVYGEMMALDPKPMQSWCVILQTFAKKNRKDVVGEFVKAFGLDEKEASDAVANLPIVVVDLLDLNLAKTIKEKLEKSGAEIEITNHDIIKKQCYRIEWPTQPDLTYFTKAEPPSAPQARVPTPVMPKPTPIAPTPVSASEAKTPAFPRPTTPLTPARASTPAPLPKKSWFPFGKSKEKKAETPKLPAKPAPKSILSAAKSKSDEKAFQPKSGAADLNQTEWQKRTQDIEDRLKRMGSSLPSRELKPVSEPAPKSPEPPAETVVAPEVSQKPVEEKIEFVEKTPDASPAAQPVELVKKQPENLVNQSNDLLDKIQKLEQELVAKKQGLEEKHAELERRNQEVELKHRQAEEAQKMGSAFSEKVEHLEKALTEKERVLNSKHSELEEKSEREKSLSEKVAGLQNQLAEKVAELETRKQEAAQLSAQFDESLKVKDQELEVIQRRMQEIAQKFQTLESGVYEKQDAIARKDAELQAKEQKIRDLQARSVELEQKAQDAQALEKDKEQQVSGLQAREKELLKKIESLEKTLVEMGESLGQRDASLRQRDEVLVALERRVQDLAEKTGNFDTIKAAHAKMQEDFEELSGKYNRLSEEYRRFRSKNERKTASLTREMGEWVRKVDHLRQGLQKFNQNITRPDVTEEAEPDSEAPSTPQA